MILAHLPFSFSAASLSMLIASSRRACRALCILLAPISFSGSGCFPLGDSLKPTLTPKGDSQLSESSAVTSL